MKVKLDYDTVDGIVRRALVEHAIEMIDPEFDPHESHYNKAVRFYAFTKVIDYFSTRKQYEEFMLQVERFKDANK